MAGVTQTGEVFSILVSIKFGKSSASGLFLVFFSPSASQVLRYYSLVVSGQELFDTGHLQDIKTAYELFRTGPEKFRISTSLKNKLDVQVKDHFAATKLKDLYDKWKKHDRESLVLYFRNALQSIFMAEKVEILAEGFCTPRRDYEELRIREELVGITTRDKIKRIIQATCVDPKTAEEIALKSLRDLMLVRYTFSTHSGEYGAGMLIYNVFQKAFSYLEAAHIPEGTLLINQSYIDFFLTLTDTAGSSARERRFTENLRKAILEWPTDTTHEMFTAMNTAALTIQLTEVFTRLLGSSTIIEATIEREQSLTVGALVPMQYYVELQSKPEVIQGDVPAALNTTNVIPILSPSKGKALSTLKKGDKITVHLDENTIVGRKLIKEMNLADGDRVQPVLVDFHSLRKEEKNYILLVEIAPGILGKAEEEEDIRVRVGDPVTEEIQARSFTKFGIAIIIIVVVVAGILAMVFNVGKLFGK